MTTWSLPKLLHALADDIETDLERSRELLGHPTEKGDESERVWLGLLERYLPKRYEVRRAHIVDSNGAFSDQIDIVVHDRQYSPFVFCYGGSEIIPAESVYAVFEVKQTLNADTVDYTHGKLASVRRLHRTSLPIPSATGVQPPREPQHILGGLLTLTSDWRPPLAGPPLRNALVAAAPEAVIDFICVAGIGTHERASDGVVTTDTRPGVAARFLLMLISRLQDVGTAPMLDVRAYADWLKRE